MRRARTLIDLPIISLAEGINLGRVRDIVFDPEQRAIAALVLSDATLRRDARVVPLSQIRSLGNDAVTVFKRDAVVGARSERDIYRLLYSGVCLNNLLAMTEGGNYIGIIEEVMIGERGEMLGYEISTSIFDDVSHGKSILPANDALTVGPEVATFPETAVEIVKRQLASFDESEDASEDARTNGVAIA